MIDPPRKNSELPRHTSVAAERCGLLNPYDLTFCQVIGSGGFGAVHRGSYCGEEVAIKKLHDSEFGITTSQLEEFKKEVANLQALKHHRLVTFVGAAFVDSSICIVTELMPNGSLYSLLHQRNQELSIRQRHSITVHIAEGVDFLHGRVPPFVHRDLKSLNVVMDMELNAKLCDFGLAQSMEKTHITRKESEGGSPRYMAPELFDSTGKITEKVDVWALGCLTAEVFTGGMPHSECSTCQQVIAKTLMHKELPYKQLTDMDKRLKELVMLCFDFDPRQRVDASLFLVRLRALSL